MTSRLIKLPEVMRVTALSRSSIYAFIGNGDFPRPLSTGKRAVAWVASEIDEWIAERAQLRGSAS